MMNAVAEGRHKQGTSLVHHCDQRLRRWRIEYDVRQHEGVLCGMTGEIDAGRTPHEAPSAISSDGIARGKTEGCLAVPALEDNAVRTWLRRFDEVAAPDIHTKFQRALFEEHLGCGLRLDQCEGKVGVEHREVQASAK